MQHTTKHRARAPFRPPVTDFADLAALLPAEFDLTVFCDRLAAVRGRPIALLPICSRPPRGGCLPWFEAADTDYVLVEQNTTRLHRDLLALHTIGHLLLAHRGRPVPADALILGRMPDLDWARLRRLLGPVVYVAGPHAEAQADAFAVDLLQRAGRLPDTAGPHVPAGAASAQLGRSA